MMSARLPRQAPPALRACCKPCGVAPCPRRSELSLTRVNVYPLRGADDKTSGNKLLKTTWWMVVRRALTVRYVQ